MFLKNNTMKINKNLLSISVNFCRDLSGDASITNLEFCCWTRLEFDADCCMARGGGVVAKIEWSYLIILF
jgi:hypothetical protein